MVLTVHQQNIDKVSTDYLQNIDKYQFDASFELKKIGGMIKLKVAEKFEFSLEVFQGI